MLSLVACQKSDPPPVQIKETREAPVTTDLTHMCNHLSKEMQEIDNTRTTFALEQINQKLKTCLPLLDFKQQLYLMHLSTQMYKKFLTVQRTSEEKNAFNSFALDMAQHPTIQQSHHQNFSLRDQYLLKHKGQAYIELHETDQHQLVYRRSPQYLARIFAPYFPKAERTFIENLAQQNMQNLFRNNRIVPDANEISERALFWENYIKQFPQSIYIQQAKYLYLTYSQLLFKGTIQDPVSDTYLGESSIQSDHLLAIEKLAKLDHSQLSEQARHFLKFIQLPPNVKRNQTGSSQLSSQLSHYLNLKIITFNQYFDCFSDAICLQRTS